MELVDMSTLKLQMETGTLKYTPLFIPIEIRIDLIG